MTVRVAVSCDGRWPTAGPEARTDNRSMPCRGAFLSRHLTIDGARAEAATDGWSVNPGRDLCPAHAAIEAARR